MTLSRLRRSRGDENDNEDENEYMQEDGEDQNENEDVEMDDGEEGGPNDDPKVSLRQQMRTMLQKGNGQLFIFTLYELLLTMFVY